MSSAVLYSIALVVMPMLAVLLTLCDFRTYGSPSVLQKPVRDAPGVFGAFDIVCENHELVPTQSGRGGRV